MRRRSGAVAITGTDTFLGRNLIELLESDEAYSRIIALDLRRPRTAGDKTRWYPLDLTKPGADAAIAEILHSEEIDTFVHLAFLSGPVHAEGWAHELMSVGTMHVLTACRQVPPAKLVMWSETTLYGARPDNPNYLTEDRPLRGVSGSSFLADKIEAEAQVQQFADEHPACCVTVLRLATMLGPTVESWLTRWLDRQLVPTMLGFDPLVQVVHEMDAVAAFKLALDRSAPGTFNIVAEGVLPLSTAIVLAGSAPMPMPASLIRMTTAALWTARVGDAPARMTPYLRYLCVADGRLARIGPLGFVPAYTTKEALLDFAGGHQLREAERGMEATR